VLVFVEVKTRRSMRRGSAAEALTRAKCRRVAAMAWITWPGPADSINPAASTSSPSIYAGSARMTLRVIDNAWVMDR
jgi:hypothetical protein